MKDATLIYFHHRRAIPPRFVTGGDPGHPKPSTPGDPLSYLASSLTLVIRWWSPEPRHPYPSPGQASSP